MSNYVIGENTLISIADAIREKTGTSDAILTSEMSEKILGIKGGVAGASFGDGSDGDLVVSSDYPIEVAEDTGHIFKQYNSLTIKSGGVLRPSHRCAGMVLLVKGNLVIESGGSINMDKMAPRRSETTEEIIRTVGVSAPWLQKISSLVGGAGGSGGQYQTIGGTWGGYSRGTAGVGGNGFWAGGGYGGGGAGFAAKSQASYSSKAGNGGDSEPRPSVDITWPYPAAQFDGLYGAGGSMQNADIRLGGSAPGGSGAIGIRTADGVYSAAGNNGDAYGGGVVLLVVGGSATIAGMVTANGGNGATGNKPGSYSVIGAGGGAGGGGIVSLLCKGTIDMLGNVTANGGTGGAVGTSYPEAYGVDGSVGTIYAHQVDDDLNIVA